MGVGFAASERPRSCHASPGGILSLMPAMSAGVLIFFFTLRPTCRVPKKVGPRILIFICSSACFLYCAPRSLDQKALRWFASRKRYAEVRIDHARVCLGVARGALLP